MYALQKYFTQKTTYIKFGWIVLELTLQLLDSNIVPYIYYARLFAELSKSHV